MRYWKVLPYFSKPRQRGTNFEKAWNQCGNEEIVAIGHDTTGRGAHILKKFKKEISEGDTILACLGKKEIVGIGISGNYERDSNSPRTSETGYEHIRNVDWECRWSPGAGIPLPSKAPLSIKGRKLSDETVQELGEALLAKSGLLKKIEQARKQPSNREQSERDDSLGTHEPELTDDGDLLKSNPEVEKRAMKAAMMFESRRGGKAKDVSDENRGYDILSRDTGGERFIEVKGRRARGAVTLTPNEWREATRSKDRYWLYVVRKSLSRKPQVIPIPNPVKRFKDDTKKIIYRKIPDDAIERERTGARG